MDILGIGLGPTQLLLILLVAFFVLGPERLPEVARQIARGIRTLRSYATEVQGQFGGELGDLRDEFGSIQRDLTSIQGNLRSGLLEIDSSIRSVHEDVQTAVSDVTSPGSLSTEPAAGAETPAAQVVDYSPPAAPTRRITIPVAAAPESLASDAAADGRLPDFKPGA
ncbi:MAG: twin-arginine translocase TatA/TatE family subunit [Dehalococcoidia bacterium]